MLTEQNTLVKQQLQDQTSMVRIFLPGPKQKDMQWLTAKEEA